jgi:hypothetical protein
MGRDLEAIIYSDLKEPIETESESWEKETVKYAIDHRDKLLTHIRRIAASMTKRQIQKADAEDILSNLYFYLRKYEDYDVNIAIERSRNGTTPTLEKYVLKCAQFCVQRHLTDTYNQDKDRIKDTETPISDKNGVPTSIFDRIADPSSEDDFESILANLEDYCQQYQYARNKYGADLYLVLYLRLLTDGKPEQVYDSLLDVLNISKREMYATIKGVHEGEIITTITGAASAHQKEQALEIIGKYVYGAAKIREIADSL